MALSEYYRINPRRPVFRGEGDRPRPTQSSKDFVEMEIRRVVYPTYEGLSRSVAELASSERLHRPCPWRNPRAYFAGLSAIDLGQQNSGFSEGRIWFTQDRDFGISVTGIHGIFPRGAKTDAAFDRSKTSLIQTLSVNTNAENPVVGESLAATLKETLGIELTEIRVDFDVRHLALRIHNAGRNLSYFYIERTNQLYGGWDQSPNPQKQPIPKEVIKTSSYIALIGIALKVSSFSNLGVEKAS